MKPINFKTQSAQRLYNDYMKRCNKVLSILSPDDKEESLMEINSNIFEYLQHHSDKDEMESLLNITERIGAPEETLKEVIAIKKVKQATRTFNLKYLIQALFLNITNGFVYIILSLLTVCLTAFPVLILLKLIYPNDTGFFVSDGHHDFGFIRGPKGDEILGLWFIPLMTTCCALLYAFIILLLKIVQKK